jgi:DNA phosphorothioation-dependent restriction protein DptG
MAYFAKLNLENIVEQVISINNAVITDANGVEQEQLGVDFINKLYNTRDVWKQTSYNNNIRKNLLVLAILTIKQEMLSYHLNLLILGY